MTLYDLYLYATRDRYTCDAEPPGTQHHWESDGKQHIKQTDGSWPVVGSKEDSYTKEHNSSSKKNKKHKEKETNKHPLSGMIHSPELDKQQQGKGKEREQPNDIHLKHDTDILLPDQTMGVMPKGTEIKDVVCIAEGKRILEVQGLIKTYLLQNGKETQVKDWEKFAGNANVKYNGRVTFSEVHWYRGKNIGIVKMKVKNLAPREKNNGRR